jgi:hypothetical protein
MEKRQQPRWRAVSRAVAAVLPLAVPVAALALFGAATVLPLARPASADEFRVIDRAAPATQRTATTAADESGAVELTRWENTSKKCKDCPTSKYKF